MSSRRKTRATALQILYEIDYTGHSAEEALARLTSEQSLPQEVYDFRKSLIQGVLLHKPRIDALIERFAPAFPIEQMPAIDRNILRLAIFEILFGGTSVKIAINEAVELAKTFGSDSSPRLVNGVLGSIAREYGKGKIASTGEEE